MRIAREAARQCGRADVPELEEVLPWAEALRTGPRDAQRVVLWEELGEQEPLARVLKADAPAVVLAVGPEGGLGEREIARARDAGFVTAGLGPRVLRAETAAIVALALAQQATGGLG
jgi:16S rRNA (uracil1498-N3)-methyltransferase